MKAGWVILILPVCFAVTVAAIAYAAGKTSAPDVIRAQKFELVDAEGRVRAALEVKDDGTAQLELCDEKDRPRAALTHFPDPDDYTCLEFCDETGAELLSLGEGLGGSGMAFHDGSGSLRAALLVDLEQTATGELGRATASSLSLSDKNTKVLWEAK
jgi:hypothetical protein